MPYDREVKTRTCTKEMISCHTSPFLFSQLLIRKQDMCDAIYALACIITWRFYKVLFFSTFLCRWKLNQKFNRRKSENISICKFEKKKLLEHQVRFFASKHGNLLIPISCKTSTFNTKHQFLYLPAPCAKYIFPAAFKRYNRNEL